MYDYYKLLDIDYGASASEIKQAFRDAAKKYHPDKNSNNPKANKFFSIINEGYQILSNKREKKTYDYLLIQNKIAETYEEQEFSNTYAAQVSKKRKHRYSNSEILKRKKMAYQLQREKEANIVSKFREKASRSPLKYRYTIFSILIVTGIVMLYANWFVSYLSGFNFFKLVLGFVITFFGMYALINLAYQHFFVMEITGKTKKDHEKRTFKLLFAVLGTSLILFVTGITLKKRYELMYNADFTYPVEVKQNLTDFEYMYNVGGEFIQKRQKKEIQRYYPDEVLVVKYSKNNPKIAELVVLKR